MAPLIIVLRLVCLLLGSAALVIGIFVGRNEAGKVRSYVLTLWVELTSFGEGMVSTHARLVRGTARAALAALDWVFGKQMLSLRCLWTALLLSCSSLVLTLFCAVGLLYWGIVHGSSLVPPSLFTEMVRANAPNYPFVFLVAGMISLGLIIVGLWPALLAQPLRPLRVLVACLPALLFVRGLLHGLPPASVAPAETIPRPTSIAGSRAAPPANPVNGLLVIAFWFGLGVLSDLFTLAIARWALKRCERAEEWRSGVLALLVLFAFAFLISGAPVYLARHVGGWSITAPTLLLAASVPMNLFDILLVCSLAAWVLVLVAHKLLWPLCSGLVEHAYELIPSRTAMLAVGVGLLAAGGWGRVLDALRFILAPLGK